VCVNQRVEKYNVPLPVWGLGGGGQLGRHLENNSHSCWGTLVLPLLLTLNQVALGFLTSDFEQVQLNKWPEAILFFKNYVFLEECLGLWKSKSNHLLLLAFLSTLHWPGNTGYIFSRAYKYI
jgi:hypothetical protein